MSSRKRWAVFVVALLALALALPVGAQDATEEATEPPVVGEPPAEETAPPGQEPPAEETAPPGQEPTEEPTSPVELPTEEPTAEVTEQPTAEATAPAGPPPFQMPPLPAGAEVVAQGLDYPRQLEVGPDGRIYVAEVGPGGDVMIQTPEGEVGFGMSSQVTAIAADGTQTVVVNFLPSAAGTGGASDVAFAENGLWVIVNGPGPNAVAPMLMSSALLFDSEDFNLLEYVDLYTYEATQDPDGNGLDTNPTDIEIGPDGMVYMLDTGSNAVYTWTEEGGLAPFAVWPENPVPTGLAFDADGNLWVSFLGAEIAPGAGMVQQLSPEGEILATYEGYNALTDIAIASDGSVYVVSLLSGFGAEGPLPGQVLRVGEAGPEVVVDGLLLPYGITFEDSGSMLVTTGTSFLPPGTGMVLRFAAPGM